MFSSVCVSRSETVVERMLCNWMSICLYQFLRVTLIFFFTYSVSHIPFLRFVFMSLSLRSVSLSCFFSASPLCSSVIIDSKKLSFLLKADLKPVFCARCVFCFDQFGIFAVYSDSSCRYAVH